MGQVIGIYLFPVNILYYRRFRSLDKDFTVLVREAMFLLQYRSMKENLHCHKDSNDKLFKVRSHLNLLIAKFQQFSLFSHDIMDEQMIPYRGEHSAKSDFKIEGHKV